MFTKIRTGLNEIENKFLQKSIRCTSSLCIKSSSSAPAASKSLSLLLPFGNSKSLQIYFRRRAPSSQQIEATRRTYTSATSRSSWKKTSITRRGGRSIRQMDKKYKGITDHKKEASKRHRRVDFKQRNIGITTATEAVLLTQKKFLLYYVNN